MATARDQWTLQMAHDVLVSTAANTGAGAASEGYILQHSDS